MTPLETITRAEFEDRLMQAMTAMRKEFADGQARQDADWNAGFRAIRDDVKHGIDVIREDVSTRADQLERLFNAQLDPVKTVAYGMVALMVIVLGALLTGVLRR